MKARWFLVAAVLAGCGGAPAQPEAKPDAWRAERNYPPLVFTSMAFLDCSISSTKPGLQKMTTTSGQGFTFETPMKPIDKSEVALKGAGMKYEFDAFPTGPFDASFSGLGRGRVTEMKAEVAVDVKRFTQPGGPGTEIAFRAEDINSDAAYVEFTGLWVREDGKRFPFRVLFSKVPGGEGKVVPSNAKPVARIESKMVMIGTPEQPASVTTSLYEEEADVTAPR